MTPNVELLTRTLEHVQRHPELHDQGVFRCETTKCFAGWAAELAGGAWAAPADTQFCNFLVAEPGDPRDHVEDYDDLGKVVDVEARAQRVLRLNDDEADSLFYCSRDSLPRVVESIVASATE